MSTIGAPGLAMAGVQSALVAVVGSETARRSHPVTSPTTRPAPYSPAASTPPSGHRPGADASAVAQLVSLARETGLELAVRSGGCSPTGHSAADGASLLSPGVPQRLIAEFAADTRSRRPVPDADELTQREPVVTPIAAELSDDEIAGNPREPVHCQDPRGRPPLPAAART